jgi:hypothetical protein
MIADPKPGNVKPMTISGAMSRGSGNIANVLT